MEHFHKAITMTLWSVKERISHDLTLQLYVDDIIIGTNSNMEHDAVFKVLLEELQKDGWTINP